LAAECANEQGKFLPYAGKLYATQAVWSKQKDATAVLEGYAAQLGLNGGTFNQCLTGKKYNDQVAANAQDGQSFAVQATPSVFVGSDLMAPTATYADVKSAIETQLAK